jgi:ubiquinone/menaquinone biosynthesis C-methylase UbiE
VKTASPQYGAKTSYDSDVPEAYEESRFSGILGRYRYHREQHAIRRILRPLARGVTLLDCPCGTGRWWSVLAEKASSIVALDVSERMINFARQRAAFYSIPIEVGRGEAEALELEDESVEYVFSHALTKHLPVPVQYQVLGEFARVARLGVICSFGIFNHFTYEIWRRRGLKESYPVVLEELQWMASAAGLEIHEKIPCTTPLGVEHTVRFGKKTGSVEAPRQAS